VPVLRPNEAAFEAALDAAAAAGRRIGLLVTFPPSLPALVEELKAMAAERGVEVTVEGRVADGALKALQSGKPEEHDRLIAAAAASLPPVDALVLGQFSMAGAADGIAAVPGRRVLTTPATAVEKLKRILGA
jgi:Asp/Glu/hydantoin racemase